MENNNYPHPTPKNIRERERERERVLYVVVAQRNVRIFYSSLIFFVLVMLSVDIWHVIVCFTEYKQWKESDQLIFSASDLISEQNFLHLKK